MYTIQYLVFNVCKVFKLFCVRYRLKFFRCTVNWLYMSAAVLGNALITASGAKIGEFS